jgi:membrane protein involved in colicin uptake
MTYKVQIDDEVRDATADEIAEIELRAQNEANRQAAQIAEAEAKAQAKAAAQSKLAALGLTVEDLTALGL